MIKKIFPPSFDNNYDGSKIAILILFIICFIKALMGLNISGFNPLISNIKILTEVDNIPLSTFSPIAATEVVNSAASWAFILLILSFLGFVAIFKYRTMLPLIYLIFIVEQWGRKLIYSNYDISNFGENLFSVASLINNGFLILLVFGFCLLIFQKPKAI